MKELMSIQIDTRTIDGAPCPVYLEIFDATSHFFISQYCFGAREIIEKYATKEDAYRDFSTMVFENGIVGNNP